MASTRPEPVGVALRARGREPWPGARGPGSGTPGRPVRAQQRGAAASPRRGSRSHTSAGAQPVRGLTVARTSATATRTACHFIPSSANLSHPGTERDLSAHSLRVEDRPESHRHTPDHPHKHAASCRAERVPRAVGLAGTFPARVKRDVVQAFDAGENRPRRSPPAGRSP